MKRNQAPSLPVADGLQSLLGLVPALIAVVLYTATAGFVPVPGESARTLYAYTGLDPFPQLLHPLWGLLAGAVAGIGQNPAFSVGIFSALCGAVSVYLFFEIMAGCRIRYLRVREAPDTSIFCGFAAATYLLGSVPFWTISTRAHPLALHILLLLATLWLLATFIRTGTVRSLILFSFLLGLGLAEYPAMVFMVVPMTVVAGLHAVRLPKVGRGHGVLAFVAFFAGLSLMAYAAWSYMQHPAQAYLGGASFLEALQVVSGASVQQVRLLLQDVGWLLVAMFAVIPWLLAYLAAQQTPVSEEPKGSMLVYGLLTLLALQQLMPSRFTPFFVYQELGILVVAPSLFIAAYFGYAMAYWFSRIAIDVQRVRTTGIGPAWWLTLPALILLGVAASLNHTWVDARPAAAVYSWVQQVSRALPEDGWLVTHGQMDDLFALSFREGGENQKTLNLSRADDEAYRLHVASKIEDTVLQRIARTSLPLFLSQWMREGDITEIAFLDLAATPWARDELPALPYLALYRGIEDPTSMARRRLLEDHRSFWNDSVGPLKEAQLRPDMLGRLSESLVRHSAKVANDFGALMDELGDPGIALEAYQAALNMDPSNSSALLNRYQLLARLGQADEGQRLWDRVYNALVLLTRPGALRYAEARYGVIRNPSWANALSIVSGIPDSPAPPRERLAGIAFAYASGQNAAALQLAEELVRDFPRSPRAGTLKGLFAYLLGDHEKVEQTISAMDVTNLDWAPLPHLLGHLALEEGEKEEAMRFWQRALSRRPAEVAYLEDLIELHLQSDPQDEEEISRYMARLMTLDPDNAVGNQATGLRHFQEGQFASAADAFRRALRRGDDAQLLHPLAMALQQSGRTKDALFFARRAAELDPGNPIHRQTMVELMEVEGIRVPSEDLLQIAEKRKESRLVPPPTSATPASQLSPEVAAVLAEALVLEPVEVVQIDAPAILAPDILEPQPEPEPAPQPALEPEIEVAAAPPLQAMPRPAPDVQPAPEPIPDPVPAPAPTRPAPAPVAEREAAARPPLDW